MKKFLIILNPNASKKKALKLREPILSFFERNSLDCDMVLTARAGDAEHLALDGARKGYENIIAAGGDGTVNETVNGLMKYKGEKRPGFGIIPVGRGNDFAWIMKIPSDIDKAMELIAGNHTRDIDVGFCRGGNYPDGRYFVNGLGIGFEPLVNFTAMGFKHLSGIISYVFAFFKVFVDYPDNMNLRIKSENKEFELHSQQLSVCNGRRMGAAFIMGPNAEVDDGVFDIVYSNRKIPRHQIFSIVKNFFAGTQLNLSSFESYRCRSIKVVSDSRNMPIHVDGEVISFAADSIEVEMAPEKLSIIC